MIHCAHGFHKISTNAQRDTGGAKGKATLKSAARAFEDVLPACDLNPAIQLAFSVSISSSPSFFPSIYDLEMEHATVTLQNDALVCID